MKPEHSHLKNMVQNQLENDFKADLDIDILNCLDAAPRLHAGHCAKGDKVEIELKERDAVLAKHHKYPWPFEESQGSGGATYTVCDLSKYDVPDKGMVNFCVKKNGASDECVYALGFTKTKPESVKHFKMTLTQAGSREGAKSEITINDGDRPDIAITNKCIEESYIITKWCYPQASQVFKESKQNGPDKNRTFPMKTRDIIEKFETLKRPFSKLIVTIGISSNPPHLEIKYIFTGAKRSQESGGTDQVSIILDGIGSGEDDSTL